MSGCCGDFDSMSDTQKAAFILAMITSILWPLQVFMCAGCVGQKIGKDGVMFYHALTFCAGTAAFVLLFSFLNSDGEVGDINT